MMKVVLAFAFASSGVSLAPSSVQTSKTVDRRAAVGAGVASAFAGVSAALAAEGESPKFSFFGIGGNADTFSEGAAYGIDANRPSYSPYSPYPPKGESSVYKKGSKEEVAFKKNVFSESAKRVAKVDKYIEAKKWEEVRAELDRQTYEMRGAMNYLASGKPEAEKAKKKFYAELESVNLASKKKDPKAAAKEYGDMMAALDAFTKLI
uniref:Uncharacterized protein n=1 Tax=Aureoumbra lagunensis TaxID=44058 RepID=A0A7S3K4S5_9STRA|mmetsp:Transcript_18006/g.23481  ORF Transcript_18006/g.23481 Transcript_18006/m.23481 type:complete len:207 (+) Transcript_18006:62-682(+)